MNVLETCNVADKESSIGLNIVLLVLFVLFVFADVLYNGYVLSRIVRVSNVKAI